MAKTTARWIKFDDKSLTGSSTLTVYLDSAGGLERTSDGIRIAEDGVTNDMLEGDIGLDKLVKTVIVSDGSQDFQSDQSMGGNKLTNLAQASKQQDAVNLAQLQSYMSSLSFQEDVLATQKDDTLDPGTPNDGDRYIITDTSNIHDNFTLASDVEDNDIVQYNSDESEFEVVYDVSEHGSGAMAWDEEASHFKYWDGSSWSEHGGLSGVTAGDGLEKTSNTLNVVVSDIAGKGLEDDGSNNLRLAAQGDGIDGGEGSTLSVQPDTSTGGDVAPVKVSSDGVGVDVTDLDGDHLEIDFEPSNYNPDDSPDEAADEKSLAAHLKGIDSAISSVGTGNDKTVYKEVTSGMLDDGLFTLSYDPLAPELVKITPIGGPQQVNKQAVGSTGATPDFDVLNTNEVHINNSGDASGLSEVFKAGDILMVEYPAA